MSDENSIAKQERVREMEAMKEREDFLFMKVSKQIENLEDPFRFETL